MKSSEWTSPAHSGEGEIFSRLWGMILFTVSNN